MVSVSFENIAEAQKFDSEVQNALATSNSVTSDTNGIIKFIAPDGTAQDFLPNVLHLRTQGGSQWPCRWPLRSEEARRTSQDIVSLAIYGK